MAPIQAVIAPTFATAQLLKIASAFAPNTSAINAFSPIQLQIFLCQVQNPPAFLSYSKSHPLLYYI